MVRSHDHQWHIDEHKPADYEGGRIRVTEICEYTEIRGSHTSDRLDETFYDEGPSCEAERVTIFDVEGPFEGGPEGEEIEYGDEPALVEDCDIALYERVTGYDWMDNEDRRGLPPNEPVVLDWYDRHGVDEDDHYISVEVDGETYYFEAQYQNTRVRNEW